MKSILVAGFLIFSTVSQSQTPLPYIEGVVAIRGGVEVMKIIKDRSGKVVCVLGQNSFPLRTDVMHTYPVNGNYETRKGFYALQVGELVGSITESPQDNSLTIKDMDGKPIGKFVGKNNGLRVSARATDSLDCALR